MIQVERYAPSFRRSLWIQLRVIHALMMREMITRFGRHNLGVLWLVVEPMLFTMGVALLWRSAGLGHGSGLPIIAFAVTGYSSVLMWRNTIGRCNYAIVQNLSLLYHRNVKVLDLLVTRILVECAGAIASFTILTTLLIWWEQTPVPEDPLKVTIGLLLLAWCSAGLGLCVGAAASLHEMVDRVWHPVSYVLLPLSGAGFMVEWLPPGGRDFVLLLPMVHCLEYLREGYFGGVVHTFYDIPYVIGVCMGLTLAGLFLTRVAAKSAEGL